MEVQDGKTYIVRFSKQARRTVRVVEQSCVYATCIDVATGSECTVLKRAFIRQAVAGVDYDIEPGVRK